MKFLANAHHGPVVVYKVWLLGHVECETLVIEVQSTISIQSHDMYQK